MKRITLISPYPDVTAFGIRTISSYLRSKGHQTKLIFLPDPYGDDIVHGQHRYKDHIFKSVIDIASDSDLIGITLMTNFFDGAAQITENLKSKLNIPIIWGGVHPTIRPSECLELADMVCIGDGEDPSAELINRMDNDTENIKETPGIWFKNNGSIIENPIMPINKNLDTYPMPDYSCKDHYVLENDTLAPLDNSRLEEYLRKGTVSAYLKKIGYQTMTGRGCPHRCTYCINDTIKALYKGQGYLRWRSNKQVIEELKWVKENMPYIGYIWISDDTFFARRIDNIREFCDLYKKEIAMPFSCLASPLTITEEKMALLIDAGLMYVQMGVESASQTMQELYARKSMSNDKMMRAINIINQYKNEMRPPSYDFILDVPYETDKDRIDSLRFISQIPKPYRLQPFSLVLYPGTGLYNKAAADGLIKDEKRQIYSKSYTMRKMNYLNLLFTLAKEGKFPSALLRILISSPVVNILNSKQMAPIISTLYSIMKTAYRLAKKAVNHQ
ncbi:Fe-S oxidoreductase [Candidatus Magnetoovum chiemensis]|nr:Fe-S oxidoreductase [Candidatus Magnetoovum chiemensis]